MKKAKNSASLGSDNICYRNFMGMHIFRPFFKNKRRRHIIGDFSAAFSKYMNIFRTASFHFACVLFGFLWFCYRPIFIDKAGE